MLLQTRTNKNHPLDRKKIVIVNILIVLSERAEKNNAYKLNIIIIKHIIFLQYKNKTAVTTEKKSTEKSNNNNFVHF